MQTPQEVPATPRAPNSAVSVTGATRLSPRRGIPFISRGVCDGRRRQEAGWRVP